MTFFEKKTGIRCDTHDIASMYFLSFILSLICLLNVSCGTGKKAAEARHTKNKHKMTRTEAYIQVCPVAGKVISPFGKRGERNHTGTDIKLQKGDTVKAALAGVVSLAEPYYAYGNLVILHHPNNIETYYAHLSKCMVSKGDSVQAGEAIGLGGRTGRATTDHLHFEVRFNKIPENAEKFFNFADNVIKEPMFANVRGLEPAKEKTKGKSVETGFVTVEKGDTLYSIAKRNNTTVEHLQEINQLEGTLLKTGMKLKIK